MESGHAYSYNVDEETSRNGLEVAKAGQIANRYNGQ